MTVIRYASSTFTFCNEPYPERSDLSCRVTLSTNTYVLTSIGWTDVYICDVKVIVVKGDERSGVVGPVEVHHHPSVP